MCVNEDSGHHLVVKVGHRSQSLSDDYDQLVASELFWFRDLLCEKLLHFPLQFAISLIILLFLVL